MILFMGWFTKEKPRTPITDLQKALVVSFSGTLIGTDNPNLDYHLAEVRRRIGLSQSEFDKYIENVEFIIGNMGIMGFNSFDTLTIPDKNLVKDVLSYALNNGNQKFNPNVQGLYKAVLSLIK